MWTLVYLNHAAKIKSKLERACSVFKMSLPLINQTGCRAVTTSSMCALMVCSGAGTFYCQGTRAGQLVWRAFCVPAYVSVCMCVCEKEKWGTRAVCVRQGGQMGHSRQEKVLGTE